MAEESPLQQSTDISSPSYKPSLPTFPPLQTLEQDSSSIIHPFTVKPQESLISPDQSPKNPRPNFEDCPFVDSNQKLNLDEVAGDSNGVSGFQLGKNQNLIEGFVDEADLGSCVLKQVSSFDDNGESSELLPSKNDVGFELNDDESSSSKNGDHVAKPKTRDSNSNKGDHVACELTLELIDETIVVGIVDDVGKKSGRRGKKGNSNVADSSNGDVRQKMRYSRKELMKLKSVKTKSQKKFWQMVYNGFDDNVRKEYSELGSFRKNKHQPAVKRNSCDQGKLGDSSSENVVHDVETKNSNDEELDDWSEDENSDDEYQSIQRPAFMVKGEPDFESGPPEDGFEYLRRVRWEAAHIPKVKVVKLDKSKVAEQSVYMPDIPEIEKCPPHLAPSSQWEDEFVADFSELRLILSMSGDTDDSAPLDSDSIGLVIFGRPESTKHTSKSLASLELPAGGPTVSTLLAMDPVTRVALLNRRISLFESASNLSKDECAWLFALCAVVDTPLDANTSASLRCLLRRCAKLRAEKVELDDEVVMLNILGTIAGKIFKQSEN